MREELLVLSVVSLWGGNFILSKLGLREIPPYAFSFLRFALSAAALFAALAFRRHTPPPADGAAPSGQPLALSRAEWGPALRTGILSVGFFNLLFTAALARTTAANGSLIMGGSPIMTALFAWLFFRERLSPLNVAGIAVAFTGLFLVIRTGSAPMQSGGAALSGDLLMLVASALWALYPLLSRPLLKRREPLSAVAWICLIGAVSMAPMALPEVARMNPAHLSATAWLALLYSAVPAGAYALVVWIWAGARQPAAVLMVHMFLVPVVASALAVPVLGERLYPAQVAGAALTLGGVYLARRKAATLPTPTPQRTAAAPETKA